jgi:hypothetical protein
MPMKYITRGGGGWSWLKAVSEDSFGVSGVETYVGFWF